jgi:DNA-binding beta-propeller fold protein YncE
LPGDETCDGTDEDCDGLIDEGLRNACGECGEAPTETCDSLDNDCDGLVDEGLVNACGTCAGEVLEEICGDNIDNDCNGLADEGCACVGEDACYTGPPATRGVGQCADGNRTCEGEFWSECGGSVTPTEEICDGIDNNCNGLVDEGPNNCSICGPQPEVCDGVDNDCDGFTDEFVTNSCGFCAEVPPEEICGNDVDDDCDGLMDEGLLNACGLCGDTCYTNMYGPDDSGGGTTFDNSGEAEGLESDEEGLRLGRQSFTLPFLWAANAADNTVSKIDTTTNMEVGRYTVGESPSRTAVDLDGNVWVACRVGQTIQRIRAFDCTGQDCVDDPISVGYYPRGVAVDANNFVWVGNYADSPEIMKIDPATMQIVQRIPAPGKVYGIAIDSEGNLWTSGRATGTMAQINVETGALIQNHAIPYGNSLYGIAVDAAGNIWLGNYSQDNILRFNPSTAEWSQFTDAAADLTRGVAVDANGFAWVANSGSDNVTKVRVSDGQIVGTYPVGDGPIGVAVDTDGNIWTVNNGSDDATKLSPEGAVLATVGVGNGPYSYSDMTGFQLRTFTARQGIWTTVLDCGYAGCTFDALNWSAIEPAGTSVELRARVSDDASTWGTYVGPHAMSPAILGLVGRYLEIEVKLQTSDDDFTPIFQGMNVDWQRP